MLTTALIVVAGIALWALCGIINHVTMPRIFGEEPCPNVRDLMIALGPIGTVMLLVMGAMMGFIKFCTTIGDRFKARA